MTSKQQATIKSFMIDANNCLNGIFPSFDSVNRKFHSGNRLVNLFSNQFLIHKVDCSLEKSKSQHCSHLDNIIFTTLSNPSTVTIVSDVSIKNNIATSIAHVHFINNLLKKMFYHTINVMTMEAKPFAIRCRIN